MAFSIPIAGMQAASAALDNAANGIAGATNTPSKSTVPAADSVDLSTFFANLVNANLDFMANVKTAMVEDNINQSTFSILG